MINLDSKEGQVCFQGYKQSMGRSHKARILVMTVVPNTISNNLYLFLQDHIHVIFLQDRNFALFL